MIKVIELEIERDVMETPKTDKATLAADLLTLMPLIFSATDYEVVDADFARQLERENKKLRRLLDKASRALTCFVDLRGMTASELKSVHNGICALLEKTRMLDAIKAGAEKEV